MKFYLSSYKVGNQTDKLLKMIDGRTIGFIPNALDFVEEPGYTDSQKKNMKDLADLGIKLDYLDLREYFEKQDALQGKIDTLGGLRIRGGNVYVLRQAMQLSGLDTILRNMERPDFLYAGYSAGPCVASPSLKWYDIVDDPTPQPYGEYDTLRDGLGLIDFQFVPHYDSDHFESERIGQEVDRMINHKILFKALRDGEVIIIE